MLEGGPEVVEVALEERRHPPRPLLGRFAGGRRPRHEHGEEVGLGLERAVELLGALPGLDGLGRLPLLLLDVVDAHERGRVADVLHGLLVLLDEELEDARVALDLLARAVGHEVDDLRRLLLPVAVDPAVALLEHHERPRHVEVDHPVREVVEVDPLGGDVGGEEEPDRGLVAPEVLDDPLLVHVREPAVEDLHLLVLQPEVPLEVLVQELQRLDALGEDDEAVLGVVRRPAEPAASRLG